DETALFALKHSKLRTFKTVLDEGAGADLAWLARRAADVDPDQAAFIVYTSGTTGQPKGAVVCHGKHLAATYSLALHYPTLSIRPHRTVAYLPLCHVLGRDIALTLPLFTELVPHFGESVSDLPTTLFETAPTVLFTVPPHMQKRAAQILVAIAGSGGCKRLAFERAMRFARVHIGRRWDRTASAAAGLAYAFWRALVFLPILNKIGFDRLELVLSGGAPLATE